MKAVAVAKRAAVLVGGGQGRNARIRECSLLLHYICMRLVRDLQLATQNLSPLIGWRNISLSERKLYGPYMIDYKNVISRRVAAAGGRTSDPVCVRLTGVGEASARVGRAGTRPVRHTNSTVFNDKLRRFLHHNTPY